MIEWALFLGFCLYSVAFIGCLIAEAVDEYRK